LAGTLTTLYTFSGPDGAGPNGLTRGVDGNFYGQTSNGGTSGSGTVFKIASTGTLATLHSFDGADGFFPASGLVQGTDGNFYGTTVYGGAGNQGTVFKMTPEGVLTTLYSFSGTDGTNPYGGLVQAADGNFYGTTTLGGTGSAGQCGTGCGTVFRITPGGVLTTLYNFSGGPDGSSPVAALMQASDGNLYGTTNEGGPSNIGDGWGTIFKITPAGALTTVYNFCAQAPCADGGNSWAALIQATDGSLYGTTQAAIFAITLGGNLTTLHTFSGTDGTNPAGGLVQASDGNFYGTTEYGGVITDIFGDSDGTIFRWGSADSLSIAQNYGVVNSASYQAGVVPNSWVSIFGTDLSPVTDAWGNAIVDGVLPMSLDGVSVSIGGQPAYIAYVSPTQINAVAPDVGAGVVTVMVTNSGGTSSPVTAVAQTVQPAFFQWGNYAVATHSDYSPAAKNGALSGITTVPAKPGEVIILWGSGFGPTNPAAPGGVETPSGNVYYTAEAVTVSVGSVQAVSYGAALAPGYAGLYQVAIQVPPSLGNGDYPVVATISGTQSPSTVLITLGE
jgi:uncharacterized protein (TIGR03437 family)